MLVFFKTTSKITFKMFFLFLFLTHEEGFFLLIFVFPSTMFVIWRTDSAHTNTKWTIFFWPIRSTYHSLEGGMKNRMEASTMPVLQNQRKLHLEWKRKRKIKGVQVFRFYAHRRSNRQGNHRGKARR